MGQASQYFVQFDSLPKFLQGNTRKHIHAYMVRCTPNTPIEIRVLATPGGGGRANLALLISTRHSILSLFTQHSSLKSGKINEESV